MQPRDGICETNKQTNKQMKNIRIKQTNMGHKMSLFGSLYS